MHHIQGGLNHYNNMTISPNVHNYTVTHTHLFNMRKQIYYNFNENDNTPSQVLGN